MYVAKPLICIPALLNIRVHTLQKLYKGHVFGKACTQGSHRTTHQNIDLWKKQRKCNGFGKAFSHRSKHYVILEFLLERNLVTNVLSFHQMFIPLESWENSIGEKTHALSVWRLLDKGLTSGFIKEFYEILWKIVYHHYNRPHADNSY